MRDIMILPFQIKSIKDNDPDYYYIEGIASTYGNIDLGGDRVIPGAFLEDLKLRGNSRPALWQHDMRQPIGVNMLSDGLKGLMTVVKLPKNDSFVNERVMPQVKCGSVTGMSIGYETVDSNFNTIDKCRDLKKLKLYENSLVTFPMNEQAGILSVKNAVNNIEYKSAYKDDMKSMLDQMESKEVPAFKDYKLMDDRTEWDKAKAINDIKKYSDSKDGPTDSYKDGFLYFDKENKDNFAAYKLPYVYLDGKELKVVPKALYAIVGALSGARGGIDIPDVDKVKIKGQINKYYKALGKDSPFKDDGKSYFDMDVIKCSEKRDLKKIFDFNVMLSDNAKDYIVNSFMESEKTSGNESNEDFIALKQALLNLNKQL